jgi:hypothetical protein
MGKSLRMVRVPRPLEYNRSGSLSLFRSEKTYEATPPIVRANAAVDR